jgi:hypothetical protein
MRKNISTIDYIARQLGNLGYPIDDYDDFNIQHFNIPIRPPYTTNMTKDELNSSE